MGVSSCMNIYFVYLIWFWWRVMWRKHGNNPGDFTTPGIWRPLAILTIAYKILTRMVYKHVTPILEAQQSEGQIEFRSSVGVDDAFAVLNNVSKVFGMVGPDVVRQFGFAESLWSYWVQCVVWRFESAGGCTCIFDTYNFIVSWSTTVASSTACCGAKKHLTVGGWWYVLSMFCRNYHVVERT